MARFIGLLLDSVTIYRHARAGKAEFIVPRNAQYINATPEVARVRDTEGCAAFQAQVLRLLLVYDPQDATPKPAVARPAVLVGRGTPDITYEL